MQTIPISSIIILDRQRPTDLAHVESLALSMADKGLIQPIVLNQDNRLIAGGHRLAAAIHLGWKEIPYVLNTTTGEDDLQEKELIENVKRLDLHWTQRVLAIAKIHSLKARLSALTGTKWGQRESGNLLGVSQGYVSYAIAVAKALETFSKDTEIWQCKDCAEAYNLIMRWQQEEAEAVLARRHVASKPKDVGSFDLFVEDKIEFTSPSADSVGRSISDLEITQAYDTQLKAIREEKGEDYVLEVNEYPHLVRRVGEHFVQAGNLPEMFEEYWNQQLWNAMHREYIIDISSHYIKGDSIEHMWQSPGVYDHIITDIPYGIDIDMIDQSNSIPDIATIKAEHTVDGNRSLFEVFFPAAFNCLKANAYLITWCDFWEARGMCDLALAAGFKVQRWPITWVKTYPCLNQMAQYNFTKNTEIALVMRKGVITLPIKQLTSTIECGRDDLQDRIKHPFAKPFVLWKRCIEAVTIENQKILDPFCGKGSSFITGMELGRNMYGCELDEALYNSGLEVLKTWYLEKQPKAKFV